MVHLHIESHFLIHNFLKMSLKLRNFGYSSSVPISEFAFFFTIFFIICISQDAWDPLLIVFVGICLSRSISNVVRMSGQDHVDHASLFHKYPKYIIPISRFCVLTPLLAKNDTDRPLVILGIFMQINCGHIMCPYYFWNI